MSKRIKISLQLTLGGGCDRGGDRKGDLTLSLLIF